VGSTTSSRLDSVSDFEPFGRRWALDLDRTERGPEPALIRSACGPWHKWRTTMRTSVRVIQGRLAESEPHRTSAIEAAYQHFRLDKQGSPRAGRRKTGSA
jgi:hypothetical protein